MGWACYVARMGETTNAYRILVGKSEGKRSLGRLGRRWEDKIVTCMCVTIDGVWIGDWIY
jgi:hypothetical protein